MLDITPIKAFSDNYLWLFKSASSAQCGIVDPGDAAPVIDYMRANGLTLSVILITHHHADHTGGIAQLLEHYDVPVYGPASPKIPAITHPLSDGDLIEVFDRQFRIIEIPGHTLDHIAYYSEDGEPVLFCGDTLFAGGCGRVFEGTHPMMHSSLQKLGALAPATQVYCAHEYTLANLDFANAVTPENRVLEERIKREQAKREKNIPTVPTSIKVELETNPFLRCNETELMVSASRHAGTLLSSPDEVFAEIRRWKDSF